VELWNRSIHDPEAAVIHSENYISAYEYEQECNYNMSQSKTKTNVHRDVEAVPDCFVNLPSWIAVRCWVAEPDQLTDTDADHHEWWPWKAPEDAEYNKTTNEIYYYGMIDETYPCKVLSYSRNHNNNNNSTIWMDHFRVRLQYEEGALLERGWNITNVPRSAIIMVDRPYTGNQFLRQAFRHEIQLPDDMVPESWKDLQPNLESDTWPNPRYL
jgi:hypothetical protein